MDSAGPAATAALASAAAVAASTADAPTPRPAEPSTDTTILSVRPPDDEARRRVAQRERALNAKPTAGRVLQTLLAICFPFLLIIGAMRVLTTPLFLWIEYHRPGFPADNYGYSNDDRLTYGSYAVDYLMNWTGPRYLGDLVNADGGPLFQPTEVSHMQDVKWVMAMTFIAGTVLLIFSIIAGIYLFRRYKGGIRRALFAGSVATVLLMVAIATAGILGWQMFFAAVHKVFFADGTWTFRLDDTLIRLFPAEFWMDAAIVVAVLVLAAAIVTMVLTWPTRRRRQRSADAQAALVRRHEDALTTGNN